MLATKVQKMNSELFMSSELFKWFAPVLVPPVVQLIPGSVELEQGLVAAQHILPEA
jgi:hypothetical protein